jgi:hypothetical protein
MKTEKELIQAKLYLKQLIEITQQEEKKADIFPMQDQWRNRRNDLYSMEDMLLWVIEEVKSFQPFWTIDYKGKENGPITLENTIQE